MQSQENAIELARPAETAIFSSALDELRNALYRSAEHSIDEAIAANGGDPNAYSQLERRAMIAAEALRQTHGMDLAAILTRGDIIRQIEEEGLTGVHPNGYADLTALARE